MRSCAGTVLIKILPAISTEGMTRDDLPDLIERTHRIMQEEYAKLNLEALWRDFPPQRELDVGGK